MSINFADVASKKLVEAEKPPLPPVGHYRWSVTKLPETTESRDGAWDIVTFNLRALEAMDDVDMTDYKGEVTNITAQHKFMFNKNDEVEFEKSLYRLRQFLENHLGIADESMTVAQALNASVNAQCMANIVWNQDKNNPEDFFANIGRTAPVE